MRVHTVQLLSPLRRLSAGTPLPRHQLQRSVRRKIRGRKRARWWTGLSPSNTWVKLVARRLAQHIETGIRQTGSTTAYSPCNLPLQSQQSHPPPVKPCNVQYCSSGVAIPPYSPFNTQSVRVPTTPAHILFLIKKIPASHRARGGTPTVSLALGANREGKERVKGKASRIPSSQIGSALVCVRRNVQHRELNSPSPRDLRSLLPSWLLYPPVGPQIA